MKLKTIDTGSKGNSYLLESEQCKILLDCGLSIDKIKKAINYDYNNIDFCLITHDHKDHSKSIKELDLHGIKTFYPFSVDNLNFGTQIQAYKKYKFTGSSFIGFEVLHDAINFGYMIHLNTEKKTIAYITDFSKFDTVLKNVNILIIEANYSKKEIEKNLENGLIDRSVFERTTFYHSSLENSIKVVEQFDDALESVVLVHESSKNICNEDYKVLLNVNKFCNFNVAKKGLEIEL